MKLKICMVNVFFDPDMVGGVEWYIKDISSYIAGLGHEVEIFASTNPSDNLSAVAEVDGVKVRRFPVLCGPSYRAKVWPSVLSALATSDSDIMHCYDYLQFQTLATVLSNGSHLTPRVVTIFDVQHLVPRPRIKAVPLLFADMTLSKLVNREFDRILVRAPNLVEPLLSMGFEKGKISITQSGVRDEFLERGDPEVFRSKYDLDGNIILYLGRINPSKGLDVLISSTPEVLSENPDTKFVIIGPDERNHKAHLLEKIGKMGVDGKFLFLDPIYDIQGKRDALSASDVFVLPSGYEGTSQSVMQAMAQGAPVVTTRVGGMPHLITDGVDGFLIPYGSKKNLSSRISQLLEDPSLRKRIGRRGNARAARQFPYSQLAGQLVGIYQKILDWYG